MARNKLHIVSLKEEEQEWLKRYLRKGKSSARSLTRARILLLADEGRDDEEIAGALKVSKSTVSRIRTRYSESGLDSALNEKSRSGAPPKIDSRIEAQLTLLACSEPPEGRSRWTVRLLSDKLVELEVVESISHMSVQRLLKKMNLSLG
jgi:putative transposase